MRTNLPTVLQVKIDKQKAVKPVCFFCDLDDSYLIKHWPNEDVLKNNPQKYTDTILSSDLDIYKDTIELKKFLDSRSIPLVIVSGRDLFQLNELKKAFQISFPNNPEILDFDMIIGAVGTEIYYKTTNGLYELNEEYNNLLKKSHFDRGTIYAALDKLAITIRTEYKPLDYDFSKRDLPISPDELPKQKYKLSIEFKSNENVAYKIKDSIYAQLQKIGFENVKILLSCPYSITSSLNKYNLDIVPFSKDIPISFLKKQYDVYAVVAGDSGNDFDMLTKSADYSIVVGNAKNELKQQLHELSLESKKYIYFSPPELIGPKAIMTGLQLLLEKSTI